MKKIIALALAILMMLAIAVPAMAEEGETAATEAVDKVFNNQGGDQTAIVELGVSQAYTVTIPVKISFDSNLTGSATVTASSVMIAGNETLKISVSSTQWQMQVDGEQTKRAAWVMTEVTGKSDPVDYTIMNGEATVANNSVILEVTAADPLTETDNVISGYKDSVTLSLATPGTSQVGTYQDTLTFAAAVVAPGSEG